MDIEQCGYCKITGCTIIADTLTYQQNKTQFHGNIIGNKQNISLGWAVGEKK